MSRSYLIPNDLTNAKIKYIISLLLYASKIVLQKNKEEKMENIISLIIQIIIFIFIIATMGKIFAKEPDLHYNLNKV